MLWFTIKPSQVVKWILLVSAEPHDKLLTSTILSRRHLAIEHYHLGTVGHWRCGVGISFFWGRIPLIVIFQLARGCMFVDQVRSFHQAVASLLWVRVFVEFRRLAIRHIWLSSSMAQGEYIFHYSIDTCTSYPYHKHFLVFSSFQPVTAWPVPIHFGHNRPSIMMLPGWTTTLIVQYTITHQMSSPMFCHTL
jgi:hypothetical protein